MWLTWRLTVLHYSTVLNAVKSQRKLNEKTTMTSLRALVGVLCRLVNTTVWFFKNSSGRRWLLSLTIHCTLTSLQFLVCCESTDSAAEEVPQNVVLRTIIVHCSCGADAIKQKVLTTMTWFLYQKMPICGESVQWISAWSLRPLRNPQLVAEPKCRWSDHHTDNQIFTQTEASVAVTSASSARATNSVIHPSIHPSIHSFIHPSIYSFIHSFIHSFLLWLSSCVEGGGCRKSSWGGGDGGRRPAAGGQRGACWVFRARAHCQKDQTEWW